MGAAVRLCSALPLDIIPSLASNEQRHMHAFISIGTLRQCICISARVTLRAMKGITFGKKGGDTHTTYTYTAIDNAQQSNRSYVERKKGENEGGHDTDPT
jgi:hypothetical protein